LLEWRAAEVFAEGVEQRQVYGAPGGRLRGIAGQPLGGSEAIARGEKGDDFFERFERAS
jgi:hypothetical protein